MYNPENLIATKLGLEYGLKQIFGGTTGGQRGGQKRDNDAPTLKGDENQF